MQEVWAEEHVILHNDDMAVALLQEHPIQRPLVVLGQPCMPWLHTDTTAQQPLGIMPLEGVMLLSEGEGGFRRR